MITGLERKYNPNVSSIGIIGLGNIGTEIYNTAQLLRWNTKWIIRSKETYGNPEEKVDIIFLTIPTLDDGKTAFNYIKKSMNKDTPVVTCEKGSLSNYYAELEPNINRIGYNATVGGGTQILSKLKELLEPRIWTELEIHAVINGTLNYIISEVSEGKELEEVALKARELGYTEPGAEKPLDIINKEATQDVPMKTAIIFNTANLNGRIRAKEIKTHKINNSELEEIINKNMRCTVSITRKYTEEVIGGFKHQAGEWIITAGFKKIESQELIRPGVSNILLVNLGDFGVYTLSGPGAGAKPTVKSMMLDAIKFNYLT